MVLTTLLRRIQRICIDTFLIIISITLLFLIFYCNTEHFQGIRYEYFEITNFKAPLSMTSIISKGNSTLDYDKKDISQIIKKLKNISHHDKRGFHNIHLPESDYSDPENHIHLEQGNQLTIPTYFNCWDKWKGCLPGALFQGTCGSCWAFAAVTTLSSRFYIETCGFTGCHEYPQLNQKSLSYTILNLNNIYKFNKITLEDIIQGIDTNKSGDITETEWIDNIRKAHSELLENPRNNNSYKLLTYTLNYQSFGSINFTKSKPNLNKILYRAKQTFKQWNKNGVINIKKWGEQFFSKPLPLSAEKLVTCCYPDCYGDIKDSPETNNNNNPVCKGGTLINAWKNLRDTGTPTSSCIGYNLDDWEEGDVSKNCKELLGPNYSYCSGAHNDKNLNTILTNLEKDKLDPITIHHDLNYDIPWTNPQFFRFKAKNAYQIKPSMLNIQREIIERGPVTTGFHVFNDFQYEFGAKGMGGQGYKIKGNQDNLVGSSKDSIIYMHVDNDTKPISGHAITIVGWGEYKNIPYWICLNTWGIEWGTSGYTNYDDRNGIPRDMKGGGYFWFVRGINNCEFEDNVVAGQPNLENVSYPGTISRYGWGLPYPNLDDITLIKSLNEEVESKNDNIRIIQSENLEGGGSYFRRIKDNKWTVGSMNPPSPYTFFWPEERPVFIVGKLLKPLTKNYDSSLISVSDETANNFLKLSKIQPNPIFIIGDEQLQFNKIMEEKFGNVKSVKLENNILNEVKIMIIRSIDSSPLEYHKEGSEITIFPWRELSIDNLKFLKLVPKSTDVFNDNINKLASSTLPPDIFK